MHSDYTTIRVSAADGIGHIMLDRPRALNAFNAALMAASVLALLDDGIASRLDGWRVAQSAAVDERPSDDE